MPRQAILTYGVIAGEGIRAEELVPKKWTTTCRTAKTMKSSARRPCIVCQTRVKSKECQSSGAYDFGLVILLHHAEAGSRFDFHTAVVMPMAKIAEVMALQKSQGRGPNIGPDTMELHKQHRDELKERSGGRCLGDVVMVENIGVLPGGLAMEIRFKPIAIHRRMIRSAQLNNPTLDWYLTLEFQVKRDRPNQSIVK
ncbi:hypothetical protein DFH09DRAFT_1080070 [Mycena vulgaris]|nr:hypothetical protein DFH09DRAFT_1080070 [Mycena vulgaris]